MKVLVLGAGPAGLLAAWAVVNAGHEPVIMDKQPRKPDGTTAGVYYLHEDCNLPLRETTIEIIVSGGADDAERRKNYARKVYGECDVEVSIPHRTWGAYAVAYDGMQAMDFCWDIVGSFVKEQSIAGWYEVLNFAHAYELVVNTIPLPALLPHGDWKQARATIYRSTAPADESYMLYQANPAVPWYRASAIFGAFTLEYPRAMNEVLRERIREGGKYVNVVKVIDSPEAMPDVPENVLLTGRFGAWKKSNLSHDAYADVMRVLAKEQAIT